MPFIDIRQDWSVHRWLRPRQSRCGWWQYMLHHKRKSDRFRDREKYGGRGADQWGSNSSVAWWASTFTDRYKGDLCCMKTAEITCENHGSENLSRRMIRVDSSGWVFSSSDGSCKILGFQTYELLMQHHMAAGPIRSMHSGLSLQVNDLSQHFLSMVLFMVLRFSMNISHWI